MLGEGCGFSGRTETIYSRGVQEGGFRRCADIPGNDGEILDKQISSSAKGSFVYGDRLVGFRCDIKGFGLSVKIR